MRDIILLAFLLTSGSSILRGESAPPLHFDKTGAQVGEQLPDLPVYALDGQEQSLDRALNNRPVLLLTSSLSCPKSRSTYPRAEALAEKLKGQLDVLIVYVLEAHPKGSASPYRGYEDVTDENRRDRIFCQQPRTLDERLKLARQFKDKLHVKVPVVVDAMDNAVWHQLGGGPNMGVLIDDHRIVVARQGWFDAESMQKAADGFIAAHQATNAKAPSERQREAQVSSVRMEAWEFESLFRDGEPEKVAAYLDAHPDAVHYVTPQMKTTGHATALQCAVKGGHEKNVELVLAKGPDVNAYSDLTPPALSIAAKAGKQAIVALLIKHGADVNLRTAVAPTPLQEAALYGHRDVVQLLLRAGAKGNLFVDAALGNVGAVRVAIEQDPTRATRTDGWDRTPLDYAAAAGQVEVAKLLFSYGVKDTRPKDSRKDLALHWAVKQKQMVMVDLLIQSGSDVNALDQWESTPVHLAVEADDTAMLSTLLKWHPNLDTLDMRGKSALHWAAQINSYKLVAQLIAAGAKVDVQQGPDHAPCAPFSNGDGPPPNTPLHLAADAASLASAKALITAHASINARGALEETPLHFAVKGEPTAARIELVRLLLIHGAQVNAKNMNGETPLDLVKDQDNPIRKLLLDHGGKPGAPPSEQ